MFPEQFSQALPSSGTEVSRWIFVQRLSGKKRPDRACENCSSENWQRFQRNLDKGPSMSFASLAEMSLAGFLTIAVLLICSLFMVALGWELYKRVNNASLNGDWLLAQLRFLIFESKTEKKKAREYLAQLDRPVAHICSEILALEKPTLESGDYLLTSLLERKKLELEQGLSHLGTIAVIAPFVGLFGTVVGITKTFADVAKMGKAGIEIVSAGVSEALVATAIGLLVAIISVVLFNLFKKRFDDEVSNWDVTARSLLTLLTVEESGQQALFDKTQGAFETTSAQKFLES